MGLVLALFALLCLLPAKWLWVINESINLRKSTKLGFWCLAVLVGALISLVFVVGFFASYRNSNYGIEVPFNVLFIGAPSMCLAGFGVNAIAKRVPTKLSNLLTGLTASLWISCILLPIALIVLMDYLTSRFNMHFQP